MIAHGVDWPSIQEASAMITPGRYPIQKRIRALRRNLISLLGPDAVSLRQDASPQASDVRPEQGRNGA